MRGAKAEGRGRLVEGWGGAEGIDLTASRLLFRLYSRPLRSLLGSPWPNPCPLLRTPPVRA